MKAHEGQGSPWNMAISLTLKSARGAVGILGWCSAQGSGSLSYSLECWPLKLGVVKWDQQEKNLGPLGFYEECFGFLEISHSFRSSDFLWA